METWIVTTNPVDKYVIAAKRAKAGRHLPLGRNGKSTKICELTHMKNAK